MLVALPEEVSVSLRRHGFVEYDLTACLLSLIRPGATVLDVGAHIGYFSLLAGALAGPAGRVVAFEPTPATLTVLRDNARRAGNVTVVPAAAWSTEGELTLHDHGPGYSAYNSAFQARLPEVVRARVPVEVRKVRAMRLDDYVREHALAVDLVKIDAESAESHVLRGMRTLLSERRLVISLEVGDLDVPGVPTSRELVDTLRAAGYHPYEPHDGRLRRHEPRAEYGYQNLIFLPERNGHERTEPACMT